MKIAILLDGAFVRKKFKKMYRRNIQAEDVQLLSQNILKRLNINPNDSYRVYFYDCLPCEEKSSLPISNRAFNFKQTPQFAQNTQLLKNIEKLPFFALRTGQLSFCGWRLKKQSYKKQETYTDDDFEPELQQKGVDIKIGLDMAWASYNNITEKVVLLTADSDFIPAIKTARRCGIFVYLFTLKHTVKIGLIENTDFFITEDIQTLLNN